MDYYKTNNKSISSRKMRKMLVSLKQQYPWLKNISSHTLGNRVLDLGLAYDNFFRIQQKEEKFSKKTIQKATRLKKTLDIYNLKGHPKFKSRKTAKSSFYVRSESLYFINNTVNIEKIGKIVFDSSYDIKLPQGRCKIKFSNTRIKYINNKWILSFGMECENQTPILNDYCLGIDLGIKKLAVINYNQNQSLIFANINKEKDIKKLKKRLKYFQREMCRRQFESKNWQKSKNKIQNIYAKLSNKRHDYTHKTTTKIVNLLPKTIVMEDLNICGILKNKHLSKVISEQCWYEFKKQIKYKCQFLGINFKLADRFYPSSKLCSNCGCVKNTLQLKDRIYKCEECGLIIDRDLNAAINLEKLAY